MFVEVTSTAKTTRFIMELKPRQREGSGQSFQMATRLHDIALVETRPPECSTAVSETGTAEELRANGVAVFVLRLSRPSDGEKQKFIEAFATPNSVFKEDATTLCAIATVDSFEITFYGTRFMPPPQQQQQQENLGFAPPYPWPWKFRFDNDQLTPGVEIVSLDRQTCFDWDYGMTGWARSLVDVPLNSLGDDGGCRYLEVPFCGLVSNYFENPESSVGGPKFRVYLPPGTKECWDKVLRESTTKRRWVVSGSAGIGKSITTIYYLHLLMKAKRPLILYEMRKKQEPKDRWFLFALHPDGYHCFRPISAVVDASLWLGMPDCTYIVDLNQTDANLSRQIAQTVLVTTPDPSKIGDYTKEGITYAYVPVPPNSTVRAIAYDCVERSSNSTIEEARKKAQIEKRMYQVGPILRRLFDKSEYKTAIDNIKGAFDGNECWDTMKAIRSPNLIQLSQGKKPHSYLLMITKREYVDGDFLKKLQLKKNEEAGDDEEDDSNEGERASETPASPATSDTATSATTAAVKPSPGIYAPAATVANVAPVTVPAIPKPETVQASVASPDPVVEPAPFSNAPMANATVPDPSATAADEDDDDDDAAAATAAEGFVVVPVCREAVAMALDNSKVQTARHLLSHLFPHLRELQDGAGFEDWIILAACRGVLKGKAYPLSGKGPVAQDAVPHDVIFGDGEEHKEAKMGSQKESISAWLSLGGGSGVAGVGTGMVQPNNGFPLVDFMDRKDRGGQITLSKEHSVVVGKLSNKRKRFGWTDTAPLHVLYIVSGLSFKTFQLDRDPPSWLKVYVVDADDLAVSGQDNLVG